MRVLSIYFLTVLLFSFFSVSLAYEPLKKINHLSEEAYQKDFVKTSSESHPDSVLESQIREIMSENHFPGLSNCIVQNGEIIWDKSYGHANIAQNREVTNSSVFVLGSISKVSSGIYLYKLTAGEYMEVGSVCF